MPSRSTVLTPDVRQLITDQDGVIARAQLRALGFSESVARTQVRSGRWRVLTPGVWYCANGPVPPRARLWASLLVCGDGAAVAGSWALRLAGVDLEPSASEPVTIAIPHGRKAVRRPGVRVVRRRRLAESTHPSACPRRLRLEPALLDVLAETTRSADVIGLVCAVVQQRRTTAGRLRDELAGRPRCRWRALILELIEDVESGIQSPLERRYLHDVARAHGLPKANHNHRDIDTDGGVRYRDGDYPEYDTLVELDGHGAHQPSQAHRDRHRDNTATLSGRRTLRYGWREIVSEPCAVADEVARALKLGGWTGHPTRCSRPGCNGVDLGR